MQIWAESGKSALPICNYSQILYQFLTFTQNLKRSLQYKVNHYLASSVSRYRFTHFLDFPAGSIFVNCLLGKHPQSPLNATCGVGCAFILNTFTY